MPVLDRLSPSKISAFRHCPTYFAFRYVDGLEELPDRWMLRGTLVHEVCERLFDLPPAQRTLVQSTALLHRLWERMIDSDQGLRDLFGSAEDVDAWLASAEALLATWFRLEDPAGIDVVGRELYVQAEGPDGGILGGIIDRVDRLADGSWAITDYKTGRAPGIGWEQPAFFQLRFYALLAQETLGVRISRLRLVHLGEQGEVLTLAFDGDGDGAAGVTRQVTALKRTMTAAVESQTWAANVGRRCEWCPFQDRCAAYQAAHTVS